MSKTMTKKTDTMPSYLNKNDNRGNENIANEDLLLPRLGLCQALSPQRQKKSDAFIEGLEEGTYFNILTGEKYGESVRVISVLCEKEFVVTANKENRNSMKNSFRGSYKTESDAIMAMRDDPDGDKLEIVRNMNNYCLLIKPDNTLEEVVVSFRRSSYKVGKKLNSLARMADGPRFCHSYTLRSVVESGDDGDYYNTAIAIDPGYVSEDHFNTASKLYDDVSSGLKVAAPEVKEESEF